MFTPRSISPLTVIFYCSAGRYEVDGYVYNSAEEPKILMTGKWNESMSYQPCDMEGEPLPNTELKEVILLSRGRNSIIAFVFCCLIIVFIL